MMPHSEPFRELFWIGRILYWHYLTIFILLVSLLFGCSFSHHPKVDDCFSRPLSNAQDSIAGAPLIHWHPQKTIIPGSACGNNSERIISHFNLTRLHGEQEFTRNARFVDLDSDGRQEIVTRTMNENRVRALDSRTGNTIWVSPPLLPADSHPQASDLAIGDVDEDGVLEIIIVSYDGHVLCINGSDGSIQWHHKLAYHINNPDLSSSLSNITEDPGLELALTVGTKFQWGPRKRARINQMYDPSILVLKSDGSQAWIAKHYDSSNSNGHRTWTHDIDGDQFSEVFAIGTNKIVVFDHDGKQIFTLPIKSGGHPDQIVFGEWSSEHLGDEILYTDGIDGISIASSDGQLLQHHKVIEALDGHLQDIILISSPDGPRLLAQNIRSADAKTTLYDENLRPLWVAQLGYRAAMQTTKVRDWDGDGVPEIATGSLSEGLDQQCSLQIMELDGSPLYWHRWNGYPLCVITDANETRLLLGVGRNEGDAGRYSLASGEHMNLFIIETP